MESRWMRRKNENGEEEKFYPITHAKAIVYSDDDKDIFDNVEIHLNDTNNPHGINCETIGAVPVERTVNGKALSSDITLSASDVGAAAASHGNHVPATQTANNAVFLRNDNTWQTITPANIGAAASSHGTHVSYGTSASALGTSSAGSATTVSRSDHVHALPALTSCTGTLTVAKGGTGATSFTVDHALIGNGTSAVKTRAITNNTSMATCSGTNLATCNTVNNHVVARLNRGDSITAANTAYTTHMARAIALNTAVPSSLTNGCVTFVYA